nr:hypothetical protein [Kibdelosporangium sp. MJ126-NF4]CEL22934.1 hypothetical protein [Kibdelosporangium sp. MJ126-NF4]CTQ90073.1 hypothetical protein [Kibdelosporangium sp. MJ126-NF4]
MILYRNFESRDDLCRAALDRVARRLAKLDPQQAEERTTTAVSAVVTAMAAD